MSYSPPPPPMTTTRIPRDVLDEIKRRFPAESAPESLRLALAALGRYERMLEENVAVVEALDGVLGAVLAPKPAEAVSEDVGPAPDEDLPEERPVIELQPPPVLAIEGDGERDQDPVQRGCPACDRGAVRRGAPHIGCGNPNPPGVGDRDRWG